MIEDTQVSELIDVFEDAYETIDISKDIISGAKVKIKEARTMMKDWSERNDFDPKKVSEIFKTYSSYRDGHLKWGDGEDDEYSELLIAVMDKAAEGSKEDTQ
jgi:hypothetical protein